MKKSNFARLFLITLFASSMAHAQSAVDRAGLSNFAWKTGQVIAISEIVADPSTFYFEAVTGSRFGHVGIVVVKKEGVFVYQSDPKLHGTGSEPLENYMASAEDGAGQFGFAIGESQLTPAQEKKLISVAQALEKKKVPYNFKQVYTGDEKSFNCSEFVFTVFKKAGLPSVGEIEVVQDAINLNSMNGGVRKLAEMFGGGSIPKPEDKIISPLSVIKSVNLKLMASTVKLDRTLSDAEVYEAWDKGDGFIAMLTTPDANMSKKNPLAHLKEVKADPATMASLQPTVDMIKQELLSGGELSKEGFKKFPSNWRND